MAIPGCLGLESKLKNVFDSRISHPKHTLGLSLKKKQLFDRFLKTMASVEVPSLPIQVDESFAFSTGCSTSSLPRSPRNFVEKLTGAEAHGSLVFASLAALVLNVSMSGACNAETMVDLGVMQQSIGEFNTSDLKAKLEAQIKLDFKTDLEVQLGAVPKEAPSLLELAEHFEEIDSRIPSDATMNALGGQTPIVGNPEILATSFSAGLALSGSGGAASALGSAAMDLVAPAASVVVPAAANLTAKLASIFAEGVQHFAGGGLAGAIGASVVYPLDTVKTKMQAQRKGEDGDEEQYENEMDCFLKMVKKDGVASLYTGIGPQLLGVAPEKAMKLTVNEILLQILEFFLPGTRIWMLEIIAGGGGGFSQVLFTNPVETVKVKLQTQKGDKSTIQVIKELGLTGLYHGSVATMARDIPGSAVFFACYTLMKQAYPEQYFLDGCLAAIPAAFIVTPADVIKTKMTIELPPGEEPYKNASDCVRRTVAKEGLGGLFNGWATRVIRIGPQFGITLMIYDMLYHK